MEMISLMYDIFGDIISCRPGGRTKTGAKKHILMGTLYISKLYVYPMIIGSEIPIWNHEYGIHC